LAILYRESVNWTLERVRVAIAPQHGFGYVRPVKGESGEARAEQVLLSDSEERFRLATQAARVGIWDWDIVEDRLSWNGTLFAIHGVDPATFTPSVEAFVELVHPQDRDIVHAAIRNGLETDGPSELEVRAVRPDGSVIWVLINAQVYRRGGQPVRMLGATLDVTERKRVELALRESEERFAKAFNSSPLSLTISSLVTGKLVEVNETFVAITGYSREEAIGRTTAELGVWARPGDREEELSAVASSGRLRNCEYLFRVRNGQEIVGLLSAETIDIGGEPCALTVIQDITDRKRFEQALREADRNKDEFLATLAHELRNPLAPLRNGIEILKMAKADAGQNTAVLAMMDRQLSQMVRLVDDLLDVSRISRGKIELRIEPVELADVVRSAVETSRPAIEQAGHELVVSLPDEAIVVEADVTRLSQVLANLLNNAAKYTARGGRIRLTARSDGNEAVVKVQDNGIGIPAPMLARVFELFTQVDGSLQKAQSGLGIGLTIVKRLVEMHGGRVEARSEGEGKGSEFVVRLPRVVEADLLGRAG